MGTWSWIGFGLAAGFCAVEGFEAFMLVTAGAVRGGWRKAFLAALAGLVALAPLGGGLYVAFKYINPEYLDYAIAIFIFGLGINELKEGREDRPKRQRRPPWARLAGPLEIDAADETSVKTFQSQNGLSPDGIIGPRTRGAILAAIAERDGSAGDGRASLVNRIGVDITDEDSIRSYQRSRDLPADGTIGPLTRGAMSADATRVLLDPTDPEAVRRFQSAHRLEPTGVVDAATQAALRALRSENGHDADADAEAATDAGEEPRGDHGEASDGRVVEPDITDPESVRRFQYERGLPETGTIDRQTQGAIRAERAWRRLTAGVDPAQPQSVRAFQRRTGLEPDGVIGPRTRSAIVEARQQQAVTEGWNGSPLTLDPAEPQSVMQFQRRHGLPATGEVDAETRSDLLRELELTGGVDITDARAIAAFQAEHGLEPTGEVAQQTQGSLRMLQSELLRSQDGEDGRSPQRAREQGLPEWLPVDATDRDSIVAFQRQHGISPDGVIGPQTQVALRSLLMELVEHPPTRGQGGLQGRLGSWFEVWPAFLAFSVEGFEAMLFAFSVAHGRGTSLSAAGGAFFGFFFSWPLMLQLRGWINSKPSWKVDTVIGWTLIGVSTVFGLLHAFGVLHA